MIRGIHYFSTELKTNLMSSQGAALTIQLEINRGFTHELDYIEKICWYIPISMPPPPLDIKWWPLLS